MALRERVPEQLAGLLTASHPELRAAAVFTLGALVQVHILQCCACPNHPVFACTFLASRVHVTSISFPPVSAA